MKTFNTFVSEQILDELSNDTLQSYKEKARKSADDLTAKGEHGKSLDRTMSRMKATGKQIDKTTAGIKKALNKEEADLDEGIPGKKPTRPDRFHIVHKDGKPASLASYPDKESAIKDRDSKHKNAEVHQVGPRGKTKKVFEEADKSEYDYEGQMARGQLQTTLRNCKDLIDMIEDDENMPEWVQSKITLAQDYITTVRDYMQSKEELGEN